MNVVLVLVTHATIRLHFNSYHDQRTKHHHPPHHHHHPDDHHANNHHRYDTISTKVNDDDNL